MVRATPAGVYGAVPEMHEMACMCGDVRTRRECGAIEEETCQPEGFYSWQE